MRSAQVVEIITPKKFVLNGLWFGPQKPKRVVVWVHGLGSSMFSKLKIVDELVDGKTAVLMFNNRGAYKVASVNRTNGTYIKGGAVHEIFTDCLDDIQGAVNFVRRTGVKNIYLAGHSTGCQKTMYWAAKKGRGIRGIIILAPMSDYSAELMSQGKRVIQKAVAVAREYVKKGKQHVMLPENVWSWPWIADAQRFLSLYTGKSAEEIFTYWDPSANPRTLKSVRIPVLVCLAEKDEFADRPAKKIAAWFDTNIRAPHKVVIVPKVGHGFKGGEKMVAREIHKFISMQ